MLFKNFTKCGFLALAVASSALAFGQSKGEGLGSDLWLQPTDGGFSVEFVSGGDVAGLQFDVKGLTVAEGQFDCGASLADSHIASCSINNEGNLRVIVFSMNNAPIPDGTLVTIRQLSSKAIGAESLGGQVKSTWSASDGITPPADSVTLDGV